MESLRSSVVVEELKRQFGVYGIPVEVVSDNGPQFRSIESHVPAPPASPVVSPQEQYHDPELQRRTVESPMLLEVAIEPLGQIRD